MDPIGSSCKLKAIILLLYYISLDNWQVVEVVLLIELNQNIPLITKFEENLEPSLRSKVLSKFDRFEMPRKA
jgi:hypothetical protein